MNVVKAPYPRRVVALRAFLLFITVAGLIFGIIAHSTPIVVAAAVGTLLQGLVVAKVLRQRERSD
jgi:hypothetical protein